MVGSSLLVILDDYAFDHIDGEENYFHGNIGNTICNPIMDIYINITIIQFSRQGSCQQTVLVKKA